VHHANSIISTKVSQNVVEPVIADGSLENAIQWQAVRIAVITNEVCTVIRQSSPVPSEAVRYLASQLDLWQKQLPHELQLSMLLSPNDVSVGPENERAMLIVHIFYLGTVILLYGRPLVAAEESGRDIETPEVQNYRSTSLVAGEQISRLMTVINSSSSWTSRNWLLM
jgi:hypothetical protein